MQSDDVYTVPNDWDESHSAGLKRLTAGDVGDGVTAKVTKPRKYVLSGDPVDPQELRASIVFEDIPEPTRPSFAMRLRRGWAR